MTLVRGVLALLILLLLGLAVAVVRMVETAPSVTTETSLTPADLRRARVFINNYLRPGQATTLALSEPDLALIASYLLDQFHGGGAQAQLDEQRLQLQVSIGLPERPSGYFINLELDLDQTAGLPSVNSLRVGKVGIPSWLADNLLQFIHSKLAQQVQEYAVLLNSIDSYRFGPDILELVYELQADTLELLTTRGRELLVSPESSERLLAHSDKLNELVARYPERNRVSLTVIMSPMFEFARSRQGDPVEENRAVIQVLALHQMDIDIRRLLQNDTTSATARNRLRFTLRGRNDIAQHYLGSAALAISTEPGIASNLGLLKEMEDTRQGGSGFSFTDIAADRTGIRLGELLVLDRTTALAVQNRLAAELTEAFLIDDFRDLPEFLDKAAFDAAYSNTASASYQQQLDNIEARISNTPLFQLFP